MNRKNFNILHKNIDQHSVHFVYISLEQKNNNRYKLKLHQSYLNQSWTKSYRRTCVTYMHACRLRMPILLGKTSVILGLFVRAMFQYSVKTPQKDMVYTRFTCHQSRLSGSRCIQTVICNNGFQDLSIMNLINLNQNINSVIIV